MQQVDEATMVGAFFAKQFYEAQCNGEALGAWYGSGASLTTATTSTSGPSAAAPAATTGLELSAAFRGLTVTVTECDVLGSATTEAIVLRLRGVAGRAEADGTTAEVLSFLDHFTLFFADDAWMIASEVRSVVLVPPPAPPAVEEPVAEVPAAAVEEAADVAVDEPVAAEEACEEEEEESAEEEKEEEQEDEEEEEEEEVAPPVPAPTPVSPATKGKPQQAAPQTQQQAPPASAKPAAPAAAAPAPPAKPSTWAALAKQNAPVGGIAAKPIPNARALAAAAAAPAAQRTVLCKIHFMIEGDAKADEVRDKIAPALRKEIVDLRVSGKNVFVDFAIANALELMVVDAPMINNRRVVPRLQKSSK